jgi:hypothetical protein
MAAKILQSQNGCVADLFALKGMPVIASIRGAFGNVILPINGAVGDLTDSPQSLALQNIANPGQRQLATAMIVGTMNGTNLAGLGPRSAAFKLSVSCLSSPLAGQISQWSSIFANEPNNYSDGVVGLTSQVNGLLPVDPGLQFDGHIHSAGLELLGLLGPTVLNQGAVPSQVITLLNVSRSNPVFHNLNP